MGAGRESRSSPPRGLGHYKGLTLCEARIRKKTSIIGTARQSAISSLPSYRVYAQLPQMRGGGGRAGREEEIGEDFSLTKKGD